MILRLESKTLRRWLFKYTSIGAGLLVAAVAGLFLAPVATYEQTVRGAPLEGPGWVWRDSLGIPHLEAICLEDLLVLQGFVTAQDRMFQMDLLRRRAAGELAEIAGPMAVENDREARLMDLAALARRYVDKLHPEDRRTLEAYARGVNFFLERARWPLSVEFALLGYRPRPWSPADTILVALELFRLLNSDWRQELRRWQLLGECSEAQVRSLLSCSLGPAPVGSNAWALAGTRTRSGYPVLANDPHLPWAAPGFWHLAHLYCPGFEVAGATIPGLAGIAVGRNPWIAWGVTSAGVDLEDLVQVDFRPGSGEYRGAEGWRQAVLVEETIRVRGRNPLRISYWRTAWGPLISVDPPFALYQAVERLEPFRYPLLELNRARNWQQFRQALTNWPGPPINFVYADRQGNIGYQLAGKIPIRRVHDGLLPLRAHGLKPWEAFIPFEELPHQLNPPEGFVVTAKEFPFPANYPYQVRGRFAPGYRARRIRQRLGASAQWDAEQCVRLQQDTYSAILHRLAQKIVAASRLAQLADPEERRVISWLASWDGYMKPDEPAALLASLLYEELRQERLQKVCAAAGSLEWPTGAQLVERALEEGFAAAEARRLLHRALEKARAMSGPSPEAWRYGRSPQLILRPPVLGQLPMVGRWFQLGPVRLPGHPTTVFQTTSQIGPSGRFVWDLERWENSRVVVLTGQSGHWASAHFRDQWEAFWQGKSFGWDRAGQGKRRQAFRPGL